MQPDRTNALARTADRLSRAALLGFGAGSQKLAAPKVGDKPVIETGLRRMAMPKVGNKPGTDTGPLSR